MSEPSQSSRRPLSVEERRALEQFANLEISLDQLRACLDDVMEFELTPERSWLRPYFDIPYDSPIRISKKHLENALAKRRCGEIDEQELATWATMLLLNDAYDWEGPDQDLIADWLNDLSLLNLDADAE